MAITIPCVDYATKQGSVVIANASHRQSIVTTYRGPTNTKGSRIVARCEAKKITVPFDYALNVDDNHAAAAAALAAELGWAGTLVGGGCATASMCFVFSGGF